MATLCFDLDNTLCRTQGMEYEAAEPIDWAIERVKRLAAAGHTIIIMTARGSATGIDWEPVTRAQLERWGVTFHELRFGKPPADVFVDDRAIHNVAWQHGDAFAAPAPGPAHFMSVVELGRTFGGRTIRLQAHAKRARTIARGAGIRHAPAIAEIERAVHTSLPADTGDVVYAIRISEPGGLEVSFRPVSEGPEGLPREAAGAAIGGRIVLWDLSPIPGVTVRRLEELAADLGIAVEHADGPVTADETFEVGLPHGLVPSGPVTRALLGAWRADTGLREEAPASL
jgi:hypothetical protein